MNELTPSSAPTYPTLHNYNYPDNTTNKLNQILLCKEKLIREQHDRIKYKNRYTKISKTLQCFEWVTITAEIGLGATSIVLAPLAPILIPTCLGLTVATAIIRSGLKTLEGKVLKHSSIELIAKSKLNSIEVSCFKALEDNHIDASEFETIVAELANYENMKADILTKGKKEGAEHITQEIQNSFKDEGRKEVRREFAIKLGLN